MKKYREFVDSRGRKYAVEAPDDAVDLSNYPFLGPPDVVDSLDLPEYFATRLHNILYEKELWSMKEIRKQKGALRGVIQSLYKVDVQTLEYAYQQSET